MEGDKIIIQPEHEQKVDNVWEYIIRNDPKILSIGGESGTGKTEVAHIIREKFHDIGKRVVIISLDDYYKTTWAERNIARKESGYVGVDEIDWGSLKWVLNQFLKKKMFSIRRINKYTGGIEYIVTEATDVDVVIVEGLYASNLMPEADYRIHLNGSYKDRDTVRFRQLRGKEPNNDFRQWVLEQESLDVKRLTCQAMILI